MPTPILFTPNLILRAPQASDFEAFAAFCAHEESMTYLGGAKDRPGSWRALAELAGSWTINGYSMFSVIERVTGAWVGRLGPWAPEGWPGLEVGWGVSPEFAGRGYAYEGAVAAMDYAVDVLGWDEIIHTIHPDNVRSIRLAERLGSTNGGPTQLPPPIHEARVDRWGQSAARWRAGRASR